MVDEVTPICVSDPGMSSANMQYVTLTVGSALAEGGESEPAEPEGQSGRWDQALLLTLPR